MKTHAQIGSVIENRLGGVANSNDTIKAICFTLLMLIGLVANLCYAQTITSFTPTSGPVGTTVTIAGTGFNIAPASNIVFFGATMANVSAATATALTVTVPYGANFLYITVTNLSTHLTAYSTKPFIVTTSCSSASSFAPKINVQGGSHNVEISDIDGDGKPDLIIPDYFNNTLTVTRNISTYGNISFAPKVAFPWASGGQPVEVALGDLDGDGKPDIALGGNGGGAFISVYRNICTLGNISFAARQDFTASSGQGHGIKIIDIDMDGKPDIVSVHWSGNCLWVLRNISTGPGNISFTPGVSFATTTQPHKIDVGDLDGDNEPDVVIACFTSNTLSVFRNTSTNGIISFAARQDFAPGTVPYFVHIGDLDGDGKADIAVVNRDVATLAVYRNISVPGTIVLAARQNFATPTGTMTHYGLAFGDLDGDGKPDLAVGNYTLNITSIFRNTSVSGTISFAARVDIASGISYDVGIDDFDGDGRPDLAVTNSGTTVSILGNVCTLNPLPVELISFYAENKNNINQLRWTTASETNNDYFDVERSSEGINYEKIGKVNGNGNTTHTLNYFFDDRFPLYGINYYRLKQVDFNGNYKYSNVIALFIKSTIQNIKINSTNEPGIYVLHFDEMKTGSIKLFDISGRLLEQINFSNSGSELKLDLQKYAEGLIFISVLNESDIKNFKIYKN